MAPGSSAGDRSEQWRRSYLAVRKSPILSVDSTNRRRLRRISFGSIDPSDVVVDVGAGDGNVLRALRELGAERVVALDYQLELVRRCPPGATKVCASALDLPFASEAADVVVVMDVLHHLPAASLRPTLDELRRVLRPGGRVVSCEPAATRTRWALALLLMSPMSQCFRFSRDKRAMVEAEAATLEPWLESERSFLDLVSHHGFVVERSHRGVLGSSSLLRRAP